MEFAHSLDANELATAMTMSHLTEAATIQEERLVRDVLRTVEVAHCRPAAAVPCAASTATAACAVSSSAAVAAAPSPAVQLHGSHSATLHCQSGGQGSHADISALSTKHTPNPYQHERDHLEEGGSTYQHSLQEHRPTQRAPTHMRSASSGVSSSSLYAMALPILFLVLLFSPTSQQLDSERLMQSFDGTAGRGLLTFWLPRSLSVRWEGVFLNAPSIQFGSASCTVRNLPPNTGLYVQGLAVCYNGGTLTPNTACPIRCNPGCSCNPCPYRYTYYGNPGGTCPQSGFLACSCCENKCTVLRGNCLLASTCQTEA
jgi:hypothetical protein